MERRLIPTNGPIRYIEPEDLLKPFVNPLQRKNNLTLDDMFSLNTGDTHVLVYEGNDDDIYAIIIVQLNSDHLYIDTFEKNSDSSIPSNNGPSLLLDYMDSVALSLGFDRILLKSLNAPRLIEYYGSFDYVTTGEIDIADPDFGKLIEMEKCLS